jgi:hypothetical protein
MPAPGSRRRSAPFVYAGLEQQRSHLIEQNSPPRSDPPPVRRGLFVLNFFDFVMESRKSRVSLTDALGMQRHVQHHSRRKAERVASARRHLRPEEAAKLIAAAGKRGRYPERDKLLLRLAYRHGLRASEAVGLRWDSFDLDGGSLTITRAKAGRMSTHTVARDDLSALRKMRKAANGPWMLETERGGPLSVDQFSRGGSPIRSSAVRRLPMMRRIFESRAGNSPTVLGASWDRFYTGPSRRLGGRFRSRITWSRPCFVSDSMPRSSPYGAKAPPRLTCILVVRSLRLASGTNCA